MAEHKYIQLVERLRDEMRQGVYLGGEKLPSENELAAQTGYSRQTVRQAIGILEQNGLVKRVQGSGTYVQASLHSRPATHNVAVITTYISEYIFPTMLHGIDHVLAKNGYTSMLSATRNRVDNERRLLTELLQKPIDGLIVEGTKSALPNPNLDLYNQFAAQGIPVVFLHARYSDLHNAIAVSADDRGGGKLACEALLHKGHQKIAGLFKSDDVQGLQRYAGYTQALNEAGFPVEDSHVMWFTTENWEEVMESSALHTVRDCTAVVCYNDEVAAQLIAILQKAGISVPGQMELASFDHSLYAQLSAAPFYSLIHPTERLGRLAAEKLLNILAGKEEKSTVLPWGLP